MRPCRPTIADFMGTELLSANQTSSGMGSSSTGPSKKKGKSHSVVTGLPPLAPVFKRMLGEYMPVWAFPQLAESGRKIPEAVMDKMKMCKHLNPKQLTLVIYLTLTFVKADTSLYTWSVMLERVKQQVRVHSGLDPKRKNPFLWLAKKYLLMAPVGLWSEKTTIMEKDDGVLTGKREVVWTTEKLPTYDVKVVAVVLASALGCHKNEMRSIMTDDEPQYKSLLPRLAVVLSSLLESDKKTSHQKPKMKPKTTLNPFDMLAEPPPVAGEADDDEATAADACVATSVEDACAATSVESSEKPDLSVFQEFFLEILSLDCSATTEPALRSLKNRTTNLLNRISSRAQSHGLIRSVGRLNYAKFKAVMDEEAAKLK